MKKIPNSLKLKYEEDSVLCLEFNQGALYLSETISKYTSLDPSSLTTSSSFMADQNKKCKSANIVLPQLKSKIKALPADVTSSHVEK
jgi:hypothetical protein